jgi:hypothetical protein
MSLTIEEREQRYQYLTLWHGHRIVNGRSGFAPALSQWLYSPDQSPLADTGHLGPGIEFLRALGVRYVVVHRGEFDQPSLEAALESALTANRRQVTATHDFGGTVVFTLAEDDPALRDAGGTNQESGAKTGRRAIPSSAMHVSSSESPDRLGLLFDGDRDTRWLTGRPQTGSEWIEMAFDSPRNVAVVRMQTAERSFGDYPRELAIDAIETGGDRTLFRGSVLPQFGRGLAANLTYPTIDIPLPDNEARAIRLRQLGTTGRLFWSIHELELRERVR